MPSLSWSSSKLSVDNTYKEVNEKLNVSLSLATYIYSGLICKECRVLKQTKLTERVKFSKLSVWMLYINHIFLPLM